MDRTTVALAAIIYRVEHGNMTEAHVTRSLPAESALGKAWAEHLASFTRSGLDTSQSVA